MKLIVMALAGLSLFTIYYIYDGYGRLLAVLGRRRGESAGDAGVVDGPWPTVSVIVAAFNEEKGIAAKLDDILAQSYPGERPEIIVANDGSEDRTAEIVRGYADRGVRLLDTAGRQGKSLAQNLAAANASGDILVLTDTDTVMEDGCLRELVRPFCSTAVGCTSGHLRFRQLGDSGAAPEQSMYWNYELKLRRIETRLGLLATAAGAIMAVRRSLWTDLPAEYGDDCVIPLDVVLQGYKVEQVEDAHAWVGASPSLASEFRARIRMTLRNWTGTLSRGALLSPLRHPGYAFALWSHKMLRWLSPLFIVLLLLATVAMIGTHGLIWPAAVVGAGVIAGVLGLAALAAGFRPPILSQLGSFALANAGFAVGLLKAITRKRIRAYSNK